MINRSASPGGETLLFLFFVGGISIPPDYMYARTRSQSRQVKRRVVIDQPSRTKYYTGCPVLHCGHVPYLAESSGYQPRTPKPISSSRSVLRSRLSRAGPREHRPARCTPPPGDLKIRRCAHRSGAESLSKSLCSSGEVAGDRLTHFLSCNCQDLKAKRGDQGGKQWRSLRPWTMPCACHRHCMSLPAHIHSACTQGVWGVHRSACCNTKLLRIGRI